MWAPRFIILLTTATLPLLLTQGCIAGADEMNTFRHGDRFMVEKGALTASSYELKDNLLVIEFDKARLHIQFHDLSTSQRAAIYSMLEQTMNSGSATREHNNLLSRLDEVLANTCDEDQQVINSVHYDLLRVKSVRHVDSLHEDKPWNALVVIILVTLGPVFILLVLAILQSLLDLHHVIALILVMVIWGVYKVIELLIDRLRAAALDWPNVLENLNQPGRAVLRHKKSNRLQHVVESQCEAALDPARRFIVRVAFRRDGVPRLASGPRPSVPGVPYYPLSLPAPGKDWGQDATSPVILVHLDPGHVPSSLFTKHKTSYRGEYSAARGRVVFDDSVGFTSGEMMLQNERGEITGGVVTTVYFFREGEWVTPAKETGCKMGVSRRWSLEHAKVKEAVVLAKDVEEGEEVWLSSAVGGWRKGVVRLGPRLGGS